MRIILAIDGSACSMDAVKTTEQMQFPIGAEVKVITALDFSTSPIEQVKERERIKAELLIETVVAEMKKAQPCSEITGELRFGYPAEEIIDLSRDWLADLIIIGSHGKKGFENFWLGSTSRAVLLHAPCAVRIVRTPQARLSRDESLHVLIAIDESEHSSHLIDHVIALPWKRGVKFRCVSVVKEINDDMYIDLDSNLTKTIEEQQAELLQKHKGYALEASRRINRVYEQPIATAEAIYGEPLKELLEISKTWPADLVMLGSHGRSGIEKLIMGSVSEGMALHALCSVEVTRSPAFRKKGMHLVLSF